MSRVHVLISQICLSHTDCTICDERHMYFDLLYLIGMCIAINVFSQPVVFILSNTRTFSFNCHKLALPMKLNEHSTYFWSLWFGLLAKCLRSHTCVHIARKCNSRNIQKCQSSVLDHVDHARTNNDEMNLVF